MTNHATLALSAVAVRVNAAMTRGTTDRVLVVEPEPVDVNEGALSGAVEVMLQCRNRDDNIVGHTARDA